MSNDQRVSEAAERLRPCSCISSCRGQAGLGPGWQCVMEKPFDYDAAMRLPEGATCGDCVFIKKCVPLGYTSPERTQCDFYPSKFVDMRKLNEAIGITKETL